jgi:hypothetical protein
MDGIRVLKSTQIIILGVCFAVATIVSALVLAQAFIKVKKSSSEIIEVTGSAEKNVVSDKIVWMLSFSRRDRLLVNAFGKLKDDLKTVTQYLKAKGIKQDEMVISPVTTELLYKKNEKGNDTNEIEAYVLTQEIKIESSEVVKVTEVSRQSTELIEEDVELISQPPEYFYTKLAELKLEMLGKASADARKRAGQIVSCAGNKIGVMRSARMGVFQITPANSVEVADYGMNDTSSLQKKVTAVVHAEFSILE